MNFFYSIILLIFSYYSYGQPLRVVTLSPHLARWMLALDAQELLVGISAFSGQQLQALPIIADANGINIESVLALKPDLVLAWQGGNKAQEIQLLQQLKLSFFLSSPQNYAQMLKEISLIAQRLNKLEQAQQLTQRFTQQQQHIIQQYAIKPRRSVLVTLWLQPLTSINRHSWLQQALDLCQLENVVADTAATYPTINIETVLQTQPEWIIYFSDRPVSQFLTYWQQYSILDAVQQQRLVQFDPDPFLNFIPDLSAVEQLCAKVHQPPVLNH